MFWNCFDDSCGECSGGNSEHVADSDQDCNGDCFGSAVDDSCGVCSGGNSEHIAESDQDCAGVCFGLSVLSGCDNVCNSTATLDDCGVCDGYAFTGSGDISLDGSLDVIDIVIIIDYIIEELPMSDCELDVSDMNSDGSINVIDVVSIVYILLDGNLARTSDYISNAPSSVELIKGTETLSYRTDKDDLIGFELTLSHGDDFSITLNEGSFASNYSTLGNQTKVVIIMENGSELFSTVGGYDIEEVLVGVVTGELFNVTIIDVPTEFTLSQAYPNPFNPTISFDLSIATEGYTSVNVYNLVGQLVGNIHDGNLTANIHSFVWDAGALSSGMYILQAQSEGNIQSQKIMLLK